MSILGDKSSRWPKALSDRPDLLEQSSGLVKAHPVDMVTSLKGIMVKPNSSKASVDSQSSWATGESSRGTLRTASGSPVTEEVPATAIVGPESPMTTATPASAMEGSFFGFFGAVGTNRRLWDETHIPMAGVLRVGATARPTRPGFDVSSAQNSFSPLLGLGCEEGLCFVRKMTPRWFLVRRE